MLKWFKERWEAVTFALGARRTFLVSIYGLVVTFAKWVGDHLVGYLLSIPPWVFGISASIVVLIWFLMEGIVKLRNQINSGRTKLSQLRLEGVALRNDGTRISEHQYIKIVDDESCEKWKGLITNWNDRVIKSLMEISEADATWFSVMDTMAANPRVPYAEFNADHIHFLRLHDERLARLGQMIIQQPWKDKE